MTTAWDALPLAGAIDRAAERRGEPGALADALADDATRVVLVHRGRLAGDPTTGLVRVPAADVRDAAPAPDEQPALRWVLLGVLDGSQVLALVLPDDADATPPGLEGISESGRWADLVRGRPWSSLRDLAATVPADDAALAAASVALAAWHASHPRCGRCGEPTVVTQSGWVRRCLAEGVDHFPRTDPAVIMTVVDDDDRLLLGHNTAWAPDRWSTLAGYVEPGESVEQAVRREVHEEVGLTVGEVVYRASQPWPFPASLMLGFRAAARDTVVRCDGVEVDDARWFTRPELLAAARSGQVRLPGRTSIARALVEEWFGDELPGA
ncbi:NAD(+) diphosphatase [Luteimicrobium subarcticum]|uniref:NAD(+) diphosphatase n=1 Tax=Luteimicrobium subarcticum TaxID=620910 RepID=A0A2M8WV16_9MICO|nr:NAD(+) diphosphatase [Luteimicrobium subarcticum]PJI94748.1 NAD+ diphosphatase [Luteimicrobium subarcticum]